MGEREYVETSLAAFLKEHDLRVSKGALVMGGRFRVVVGTYEFDTGFFDGAVDQTVESYEEASAIVAACRDEALAAFKREILKIRWGVRERRLAGTEPLGFVCLVLGRTDQGADYVRVSGFSVVWDFQRPPGAELYTVEWEDPE